MYLIPPERAPNEAISRYAPAHKGPRVGLKHSATPALRTGQSLVSDCEHPSEPSNTFVAADAGKLSGDPELSWITK